MSPGGNFKTIRKALFTQVSEYVKTNKLGKFYDTVFLDEVQDFRDEEINVLSDLSETLNAAGDSRQSIWGHKQGLPKMEGVADEVVELEKHYRIGIKICHFADRILPPQVGESSLAENCYYDEASRPSSITPISSGSSEEQYRLCLDRLKRQIRYINDEPILVMAHTQATRDAFWNALEVDGDLVGKSIIQSSEGYEPFGPDSLIRVMTIASAKGSEARAVHILKADRLDATLRELAFTGVTRAKTEVALYHTGPLPGHLQPPSEELPEIDDIF